MHGQEHVKSADCVSGNVASKPLPDVVQRALRGDWPTVLRGPEIVDMIILIECGMSADDFDMWREDEDENQTWEPFLNDLYVARLAVLPIPDVEQHEHGCGDPEQAAYYATLTTKAPPIIVEGRLLLDGSHRIEAAQARGETLIDAYVISRDEKTTCNAASAGVPT